MEDQSHCISKLRELVTLSEPSARALLQIGYNLGRLAELTGLGREPFWDRWKDAVVAWDHDRLAKLAHELQPVNHPSPDITSPPSG